MQTKQVKSSRSQFLRGSPACNQKQSFENVLQSRPANLVKKETLTQVFSCEFQEIFKSNFLRTSLVAASVQL